MPTSFSNIQLKTSDADAVREALEPIGIKRSKMFARAQVAWISVYPRGTEDGDLDYLRYWTEALSRELSCMALAILVQESASFKYFLFEKGELLDTYSSNPSYPDGLSQPTRPAIEKLLPLCSPGVVKKDLETLLCPRSSRLPSAEEMAQGLAHFLEIPRAQICMGFNNLKEAQAGR